MLMEQRLMVAMTAEGRSVEHCVHVKKVCRVLDDGRFALTRSTLRAVLATLIV